MLELPSYDCYIAAHVEFGAVTHKVRTPSYSFQLRSIFFFNINCERSEAYID
jgi:hypothetical protein